MHVSWTSGIYLTHTYIVKFACNTFTPQIKGTECDTLLHVALPALQYDTTSKVCYNFALECDTTFDWNVEFQLECCDYTLVCCYHNRLSLISKGL